MCYLYTQGLEKGIDSGYGVHDWAFHYAGLATLQIVSFRPDVIELLIPITILITAIVNMAHRIPVTTLVTKEKSSPLRYPLALFFGLIHGLGFSNYLQSLLGNESTIFQPLLAFNVGLELGQILIVLIVLTLAFVVVELIRVPKRSWNYVVSGIVAGMSLSLIMNNDLFQQTMKTLFQR